MKEQDKQLIKAIKMFRKKVGNLPYVEIICSKEITRIIYEVPDAKAIKLLWIFQVDVNGDWFNYQKEHISIVDCDIAKGVTK